MKAGVGAGVPTAVGAPGVSATFCLSMKRLYLALTETACEEHCSLLLYLLLHLNPHMRAFILSRPDIENLVCSPTPHSSPALPLSRPPSFPPSLFPDISLHQYLLKSPMKNSCSNIFFLVFEQYKLVEKVLFIFEYSHVEICSASACEQFPFRFAYCHERVGD